MSQVFDRYGAYYDLIYQDKDYERECDFLESAFERYSATPVASILDGGCGTGGHSLSLAGRGYEVVGIDASEAMIARAREKSAARGLNLPLELGDLRSLHLHRRFDAAICMFAVIGYFLTNDDLGRVLRNIRSALKRDGLFIFDAWNGLAVMRILPEARVKVMQDGDIRVIRWVRPELDSFNHICRDHYRLLVTRGNEIVDEVEETHVIRYLFPQEIRHYLEESGFEVLDICPFLEPEGRVDENVWNMACIARAKGGAGR